MRIGGINGVSTDVAYRRRGYATRVLDACIERMAELGSHISLLSTGVPSWYRKQGWEYGGTVRVYRFDRGNRTFLPSEPVPDMRPATDADFEALSEINEQQAWGAVRSPDHMRAMLQRRNSTVWVAERDGRAGAYVFVRGTAMAEYGGPADLVVPMIARLLAEWDDPAVKTSTQTPDERRASRNPTVHATLAAPARADDVTDMLDSVGIMKSADYIGMIRIEDPVGLVRAYGRDDLNPVDEGDAIVLTLAGERRRLSSKRRGEAAVRAGAAAGRERSGAAAAVSRVVGRPGVDRVALGLGFFIELARLPGATIQVRSIPGRDGRLVEARHGDY